MDIATNFGLRMAVAEMECAAQQSAGGAARNAICGFFCSDDSYDTAIVSPQQVAMTQYRAANSEHGDFFTRIQPGAQAALFAQFKREDEFAIDFFSVF